MKKICIREIRHIIANQSLSNRATAYRINSKSISTRMILKLIKLKWIECKNIDGQFMFVSPSKKLATIFDAYVTEGRIHAITALTRI
ncbi:MAG: hypothetical protein V1904_04010 [Bacteroidota bacterium]